MDQQYRTSLQFLYFYILNQGDSKMKKKQWQQQLDKEKKPVLLVTAHPDDEAMFFLPTITYLNDNNYEAHLICLSNGNANKIGKIREAELEKCCKYLSINKVTIINDEQLQDSMSVMWPIEKIQKIVEEYIAENNIKGVITFDNKGISGHLNHIACYKAISSMKRPEGLKVFALETTNILRKYSSILDFFVSSILNDNLMVNLNILKAWRSMQIHHSQFVWYRKLFVVFSRYAYINTLIKI
ncbi:unnamed protein product (macronuclear) [Paramecium tetraurelia]|uniref:N-acetylglucosaminylphosphatidylinositol deacetylase n=1 Tax=Paramecium tetraurelia TaxID=5888 RepID=A0DT96_PARTE|nr:uncharacterized protein GSPATT00019956001 [Paramecium tetraurelia]CAK86263.1 unnamed protein product [Paramecium tetraurelia]|eukprot:XP_001453660.1 hypothetical protein (macronuclear) [Paramecium tetraurelia strain d4-2]